MKKIISVTTHEDGAIKGILFEGNKAATPIKTVIRMLEEGKEMDLASAGLEVIHMKNGTTYVRTIANDTVEDNLGTMAAAVEVEKDTKDEIWEDIKATNDPAIVSKLRSFLKIFFK